MRKNFIILLFFVMFQCFVGILSGVSHAITGTMLIRTFPQMEPSPEPEKVTGTSPVIDFEIMEADPNNTPDSVYFAYNEYSLQQNQLPVIDKNLNLLLNNSNMIVVLEGNADERGTNEYNYILSKHRAETVRQYFVANGVSPEQIIVYYYGEDRPVRNGNNESVWQFNRRVDLWLYKKYQ